MDWELPEPTEKADVAGFPNLSKEPCQIPTLILNTFLLFIVSTSFLFLVWPGSPFVASLLLVAMPFAPFVAIPFANIYVINVSAHERTAMPASTFWASRHQAQQAGNPQGPEAVLLGERVASTEK